MPRGCVGEEARGLELKQSQARQQPYRALVQSEGNCVDIHKNLVKKKGNKIPREACVHNGRNNRQTVAPIIYSLKSVNFVQFSRTYTLRGL